MTNLSLDLQSALLQRLGSSKMRGGLLLLIPLTVQVLVPIAIMPITLSNLRPADYGKFQLSLSIVSWLTIFTAPYITVGSISAIAQGNNGTLWLATKVRLWYSLILTLILAAIALWGRQFSASLGTLLLLGTLGLMVVPVTQSAAAYFTAKQHFAALAFWDSLSVAPSVAMAFASFTHDIITVAAAFHLTAVVLGLTKMVYVFIRFSIFASYRRNETDPRAISYGLKSLPIGLLTSTRRQLGSFLIASLVGFQALAIFSVGYGLALKLLDVARLADRLWFADFSKITNIQAKVWIKRRGWLVVLGGIVITLVFNGVAFIYIGYFLPPAYTGAWGYALITSLAFPAALLYQFITLTLVARLQARQHVTVQILFSLIEIGLIIGFGWGLGIWGVCIAIAFSRWISVVLAWLVGLQGA